MSYPNSFSRDVSEQVVARINKLAPDMPPLWGKMTVAQMLAHCNVPYEMVFETKHPKPNPVMAFILKTFVKKIVTGDAPYRRNSRTAPAFIMADAKDFEKERARLIHYFSEAQKKGDAYFDKKVSLSFGPLTKEEWNRMFYKHLDHHLAQFGV